MWKAVEGIILMSPGMFVKNGLAASSVIIPLDNPGIISIPLSFTTLVIVSLATHKNKTEKTVEEK